MEIVHTSFKEHCKNEDIVYQQTYLWLLTAWTFTGNFNRQYTFHSFPTILDFHFSYSSQLCKWSTRVLELLLQTLQPCWLHTHTQLFYTASTWVLGTGTQATTHYPVSARAVLLFIVIYDWCPTMTWAV